MQQRSKKSHYQSKVFVCVLNNRGDVVDRLLILNGMDNYISIDPFKNLGINHIPEKL